ncbi:hypothetical protein [Streptomyces sp. NPDC006355]|uniref:hypothetical protein n=1 Tax=Streptomyces sp. NPDC006355 TaxID=3156758 RepID=UPI0033B04E85
MEWQNMAHLWASDRIDFQLTQNSTYAPTDLPFHTALVGANLVVQAGAAWVGGFYYRNDAPFSLPAPTNGSAMPRIDLVVLRADFASGAVNLALKTGLPAMHPVEPAVQRIVGGVWEMPIWAFELKANNGARTLLDRRRFDGPGHIWTPQNGADIGNSIPPGNFVVNMDAYNAGYQYEGFRGRDGFAITRHLGKRWEYTPNLFTVTGLPPAANRKGYWRYIAPGTVQFSLEINNTSTKEVRTTTTIIGFTLPVPASKTAPASFSGFLDNPEVRSEMPNFVDIPARSTGGSNAYLYYQNTTTLKQGLDGLRVIPGKSSLSVSGVYETNEFD